MAEIPQGWLLARGFDPDATFPWPLRRASELFQLNYGKALVEKDRRPGAVRVFGTNGPCGWHDTALFPGPGVILGRKGQGPLGVEWSEDDYWVIDTAYSLERLSDEIDLKYSYYLINYIGLNHLKDGTSNPSLSRNTFGVQAFPLPSLSEQRVIVGILTALDDKIELNRKMNRTLEEIAQTLFRAWFVDFEGETDLVESEVGLIPRGWEVKPMDEVADFLNGVACQRYPADAGEELRVIKIRELRGGFSESSDKVSKEAFPDKYVVHDGDVLFSWSGSLVVKIWAEGEGALNQHIFKVYSHRYPRWFFYLWLLEHLERFRAIAAGKATTMGHIRRRHLSEALVPVPPDEKLPEASETFAPLLERIVLNRQQDRTLAEIRDTLLPKLISGEIRVPEAEEVVEEAV